MALAVDQIIAQLQGEDDDVDEDMDGDDIEGMENEEELPENFIENVKLELIDGIFFFRFLNFLVLSWLTHSTM